MSNEQILKSLLDAPKFHKAEELLFEYEELRKEVLQNDTLIIQLMSVILTIVGLLMGFAVSQIEDRTTQSGIFLVCCVIACFGVYHNTDRMKNTQRISSYLRIFLEPRLTSLSWERRLRKYRYSRVSKNVSVADWFKFMTDQRFIYLAIIVANSLLGVYSLLSLRQSSNQTAIPTASVEIIIGYTIAFLCTFFAALYLTISTRSKSYKNSFDELWMKIKESEDGDIE